MSTKTEPTKSTKLISWPWRFVLALATAAAVLGFMGYTEVSCWKGAEIKALNCNFTRVDILNNISRTISLFYPGPGLDPPTDVANNEKLAAARVLAPVATWVAFFKIFSKFLGETIMLLRAKLRRDHIIIVGCGERGQHFLHDCQNFSKSDLIVIDRIGDPAMARRARDFGALFFQGDARNASLLADARVERAQQLIILGGNDAQNLEVLAAAESIERKALEPLKVLIRIDHALLVRQLNREDYFARKDGFDVTAFNLAAATARCFFRAHPLVDQAELRDQQRVHLVCIGWTPFIFAVLEQLARLSPYRDFATPLVDLFVPDKNAALAELKSAQPKIREVLEIKPFQLDDVSSIPTLDQIDGADPYTGAAVTAVLVSLGNDAETAAAALAVRERSQQRSRWRAPVYSHVEAHSALSSLLEQRSRQPDPGQAVIPVGFHEDACRLDALFGDREKLACLIHESYLKFKGLYDAPPDSNQDENSRPWGKLKQTYRLACRRAADHFPIKVLSMGATQCGPPFIASENLGFAASSDELNSLSELEHKSWVIDRQLDGWRHGSKRDNLARIHPAMVSYDDLADEVQELDRDQIRAIAQYLFQKDGTPTVKREKRLGIFGHNNVTQDEKAHMLRELDRSVMPGLIHTHQQDFISVCTPLAPGSDTILTEAILERLRDADIDHRLVVVRTLPLENVVDEFLRNFTSGNAWRLSDEVTSSDNPSDVKTEMISHLSALPESVSNTYIADLTPPGLAIDNFSADEELRVSAYVQAASWLIKKSDILIAFYDPQRGDGGTGGTHESLERAQKESQSRDQKKLRITTIGP